MKYWQDILVGDILYLEKDEEIPADILLMKSSSDNGMCYVDTMNLDGEVLVITITLDKFEGQNLFCFFPKFIKY